PMVAPFDKCTDRGGRRVEDRYAVAFDDLPEAAFVGPVGRPFIHNDRCAGRERTINDIGVAGHPTAVGGAPEDILVAQVEDPFGRDLRVELITGGRVLNAFGFTGGAAGVED